MGRRKLNRTWERDHSQRLSLQNSKSNMTRLAREGGLYRMKFRIMKRVSGPQLSKI
jgi:hypothetical protein